MKLTDIKDPKFLKNLSINELNALASDIRDFLIDSLSRTGGHLASNLGIVELTIAIHYCFNAPTDKIIFDVGHQSYVHKILTGRVNDFENLRQFGGISGFQKRKESIYDCWEGGHSSTSLSAALGMAIARDLNKEDYNIVPVIGDGALANGISFEALNNIGSAHKKVIIILNDNNMSISENNFAFEKALTKMRISKPYVKLKKNIKNAFYKMNNGTEIVKIMSNFRDVIKNTLIDDSIFRQWDIEYIGPIDGHDISQLINAIETAKAKSKPVVLHVITQKGKGYAPAEYDKVGIWHGVGPFDKEKGIIYSSLKPGYQSYSSIYSSLVYNHLCEDKKVIAITPAMSVGSSLESIKKDFPDRFIDTGITEDHAAIVAASLANSGFKPYLFVYSSFSQRCYDQINHEISRMNLPVKILLDRSGLVGQDGETHHGVFDISIFSSLPNMTIAQGADYRQCCNLIETFKDYEGPVIIRFPRGNCKTEPEYKPQILEIGKWEYEFTCENREFDEVVICYGEDYHFIIERAVEEGKRLLVVNAIFIKPIDENLLDWISESGKRIIVYTTDITINGLASLIMLYYSNHDIKANINVIGIGDNFVTHGTVDKLKHQEKISIDDLFQQLH